MKRAHEIIEVNVRLIRTTDRAALIKSDRLAEAEPVWVPLALVELEEMEGTHLRRLHIPEWLAVEKGLV